jgi:hypothetical protein
MRGAKLYRSNKDKGIKIENREIFKHCQKNVTLTLNLLNISVKCNLFAIQYFCNQIVLTFLFYSTFFKNNVKLKGI